MGKSLIVWTRTPQSPSHCPEYAPMILPFQYLVLNIKSISVRLLQIFEVFPPKTHTHTSTPSLIVHGWFGKKGGHRDICNCNHQPHVPLRQRSMTRIITNSNRMRIYVVVVVFFYPNVNICNTI